MPVTKKPKPSSRKKTGGVNLAPLLSAALLALVKISLDDIKKNNNRATKSRTRTQTRTK